MLVHSPLTLALLAGPAIAKPVARAHLPKHPVTVTKKETIPTCTAKYTPSEECDCHDIALQHGIQLSNPEAGYDSRSTKCKTILGGYGICPETANAPVDITTSTSTFATATPSIPSGNITSSNSTINGTIPSNSNSTTNSTLNNAGVVTLTKLNSVTLTYIEGTGTATRERVVTITHTTVDCVTLSTTTISKVNGPATLTSSSSSQSTASLGETPSAFPTPTLSSTLSSLSTSTSSISVIDVSSLTTTTTMSSTIANSVLVLPSVTASSCAAAVAAPAATQAGIVAGCTQWYVAVPGDYCASVAQKFGIPVETFMSWNPSVNPPTCPSMLAGDAYCVATCDGALAATSSTFDATPSTLPSSMSTMTSTSLSIPGFSTSSTAMAGLTTTGTTAAPGASTSTGPASPSSSSSTDVYIPYTGDGSLLAGWPAESRWIDFNTMFAANEPHMKESCAQWGVPNDSDTEIAELKAAIQQVGSASGVDPRFILAIIMQESTGCVRVITTQYSVFNPGLMQSHNGTGSCNENNVSTDIPTTGPYVSDGVVQTPCPDSEILQMIKDGTQGTSSGDGLQQLLADQKGYSGAQAYYRTSRAYNGGSVASSGRLEDGCCTQSYASDIANRLTGWVNAPRDFTVSA